VKLLFDENLSRRLVPRLSDLYPGSSHAATEDLLRSQDIKVWEHAKERGFAIVTADADFYELSLTFGPPPKVIWLRGCDYPTEVAERLLRSQAIRINEFNEQGDQAVLILTP
jgi:predicted nuclease of predicted toxin-antitoxin system